MYTGVHPGVHPPRVLSRKFLLLISVIKLSLCSNTLLDGSNTSDWHEKIHHNIHMLFLLSWLSNGAGEQFAKRHPR